MGGVPKQRHTKSRRNKRRSQIFLPGPSLTACPHCQKSCLPHTVCRYCGYYGGKEIINVLKKEEKKRKKRVEKGLEPKKAESPE